MSVTSIQSAWTATTVTVLPSPVWICWKPMNFWLSRVSDEASRCHSTSRKEVEAAAVTHTVLGAGGIATPLIMWPPDGALVGALALDVGVEGVDVGVEGFEEA